MTTKGKDDMAGMTEGKVALITGAARGQGRAHALTLGREGADIVGIDIFQGIDTLPYDLATAAELEATASDVVALGRRALFSEADVRSQGALDHVVQEALSEFGHIDIVVANAGVCSHAPFWEMTDEKWQDVIDVNLTGVWRTVKAVAPHMVERQSGSVVLISSVNGSRAGVETSHYVAAKHGVIGLMRSFANELAPYNVRCNAVCPGAVDTAMINNPTMYDRFAGRPDASRAEAWESVRHYHLLKGRSMLPPAAVSESVAWLCSDGAEHVTGVALPVDGGHLAMDGYNAFPTQ